jgi:transcriptional antiterminator RfaH
VTKKWYLLTCKAKEEARAQLNLENQGVSCYFSKLKREKLQRGKKVVVEEALFPGYLFVQVDPEDPVFPRIRSTRGVMNFVRCGIYAVVVPEGLIDNLKMIEVLKGTETKEQIKKLFESGDKVEIKSGSFKGLTAIYECSDGLERSMALIKILNRDQRLSFKNSDLKRVK